MFCNEEILQVYKGIIEIGEVRNRNAFLDCYHDIAYHCTEGYRIVLETNSYAISLSAKGVIKERKEDFKAIAGERLQEGIEIIEENEPPWIHFETTLFVGERIRSVIQQDAEYRIQFDDFTLKLIPHFDGGSIKGLYNKNDWSYNHVLGCDRHLKKKCPHCGSDGEILLDFVQDYVVRCKKCHRSTYAGMNIIEAITDWNNGNLPCDLSDITIE